MATPALIITEQPSNFVSAGNDAVYVVSGNTNTPFLPDYKYVANVYVNGQLQCTLKSFPDPIYGFGVFNVKSIISSFLGTTFHDTLAQDLARPIDLAALDSTQVQVRFGQEYIDPTLPLANQFIQDLVLVSGSTVPYFNGSLNFIDQVSFVGADYVSNGVDTNVKFLTKYGGPQKPAYINQRQFLYYYASGGTTPGITIKTFAVGGANLGVYTIVDPFLTTTGVRLACIGYPQLAGLPTSGYTTNSGQTPMIQANVDTYQVFIGFNTNLLSAPYTYKVTPDCTDKWAKYAYTVFWLNEYGGYDSWQFNRMNRTTSNITQTQVKQTYGNVTSTGQYDIQTWDRGISQQYTASQDTLQLSTSFLRDYDVIYLKGLWKSPIIYMTDLQTGIMVAATVAGDPYVTKRVINDKIFSVSMDFNSAMIDYGQQQ